MIKFILYFSGNRSCRKIHYAEKRDKARSEYNKLVDQASNGRPLYDQVSHTQWRHHCPGQEIKGWRIRTYEEAIVSLQKITYETAPLPIVPEYASFLYSKTDSI